MAVTLSGMSLHTNNDNDTSWSGTDGPDTYNNAEQGTNSESWLVSKNTTETGTLTRSSALPTSRGLFVFWMSSNLAPYYTDIRLELQSSASNYKQFIIADSTDKQIQGKFVPIAVDYVNNGTETGTFAPASFSVCRVIVDNSSSGNIRSVINNWIDAMYFGTGLDISSFTTTAEELFAEAAAIDENSSNKYGILWNYNGIIYCQGDLASTGTTQKSTNETLVFIDNDNGYSTYKLTIESGTVTYTNTTIMAAGTARFDFDVWVAAAFRMYGGSMVRYNTFDIESGDIIDGAVFLNGLTMTIKSSSVSNCVWTDCGEITLSGVGEIEDSTFSGGTDTNQVSAPNLNDVLNCHFVMGTSGHAVELTGAAGTYAWNCTAVGYDTGSTGNGVEVTGASITGDETIHITATSGTFTINVADGATTPSVSSAGAVVNVVAGQKDFSFTVSPSITGYEWRIYDVTATGSLAGATELDGEETATADNQTYSYSYVADDVIAVQIIDDDYEESITYYTLKNADQSVTITLTPEENT